MRDQVIMSKNNANIAVAIPLYRLHHEESLGAMEGYSIQLTGSKPLAYAIDIGDSVQLVNAKLIEEQCEFLGDL